MRGCVVAWVRGRQESQHAGPAGWDAMSSSCFASADNELACGDGCLLGRLQAHLAQYFWSHPFDFLSHRSPNTVIR
jgi:hypothetical protein